MERTSGADNVAIAPLDIDKDQKLDFALGADWQSTNTASGGSLQWVVAFTAPSEEYDTASRTFDRSIATLTLPTADDDEEGGDGQR